MQRDVIEKIDGSTIQHGKYNDRIYVMKASPEARALPETLEKIAARHGYSKIFAKVPAGQAQSFTDSGYQCEAQIPRFFKGKESALLLCRYLSEQRKQSRTDKINQEVIKACQQKQAYEARLKLPEKMQLQICEAQDTQIMADLYRQVFPTYPFPIHDAQYIRQTMSSNIVYFGIWIDGSLAALSSAEMDVENRNVEMTDFATLPTFRGQGLAKILLASMESVMCRRNMITAYTIARAPSFGMNITFAQLRYSFGGCLINNTNIGGQIEDMNVWHKPIFAGNDVQTICNKEKSCRQM